MSSTSLPPSLRIAGPAAAIAVLVLAAWCAPAGAASITAAGPTPERSDGRTPSGFAATFSPDGDGRGDALVVAVRGRPGQRLRIVAAVAATGPSTRVVARSAFRRVPAGGVLRLRWNGRAAGRLLSDGPYLVRVCGPDGVCARGVVAAHLRVLSAAILDTASFRSGALVPLRIASDSPSAIVGIAADDARPGAPLMGAAVVKPGRTAFRLPRSLPAGLYRLVVMTGGSTAWRALPLAVHAGDLDRPGPGTTLVVLPHLTWSVYNEHDADRDGLPDSHYENPASATTPLIAPYEQPGMLAPGSAGREQDAGHTVGFTRTWRLLGGARRLPAAFATDLQLARMDPAALHRYAAILFLGHGEYYTRRVFDRIRRYQLHGGDFMYASANGFYALVRQRGGFVRVLSRPQRGPQLNDALVTGVQYTGCCWSVGSPGPLRVTASGLRAARWAFRGTGLRAGDVLAYAGGEIDGFGPQSPKGMTVLARLEWRAPDRPRQSSAMVLLRRPGGGRVFAPGTMGFIGGTARNAALRRLFGNVWTRFAAR